jgi:FkbM family methyltransferase
MPTRDAVFEHFPPFAGEVPAEFFVNFLGCRTTPTFYPKSSGSDRTSTFVQTAWPDFDQEYYEWVDLLEAVVTARDSFTFLELGAGYARWAVAGAFAARQRGINDIRLGVVEPEPAHIDMMRAFFSDNNIPEQIVDVYAGTISEDAGTSLFIVKQDVSVASEAREWYGQWKAPETWKPQGIVPGGYYGKDLLVYPNRQGAIEVEQFAASKLLKNYSKIDLIDLDLQGEEFVVLYAAINVLNKNTKRLHIGTHAPQIEQGLREMLTANHWECVRDYACGTTCLTPVGEIAFQDGIQTWVNPRLT